jgi:hypothetical protein
VWVNKVKCLPPQGAAGWASGAAWWALGAAGCCWVDIGCRWVGIGCRWVGIGCRWVGIGCRWVGVGCHRVAVTGQEPLQVGICCEVVIFRVDLFTALSPHPPPPSLPPLPFPLFPPPPPSSLPLPSLLFPPPSPHPLPHTLFPPPSHIQGVNVKGELNQLLSQLPQVYEGMLELLPNLLPCINFYQRFLTSIGR